MMTGVVDMIVAATPVIVCCTATSESEHSKISLNVLAKRTGGSDKQVTAMLLTLLANPAFERHFQEDVFQYS